VEAKAGPRCSTLVEPADDLACLEMSGLQGDDWYGALGPAPCVVVTSSLRHSELLGQTFQLESAGLVVVVWASVNREATPNLFDTNRASEASSGAGRATEGRPFQIGGPSPTQPLS
jgi:hypothetical protein